MDYEIISPGVCLSPSSVLSTYYYLRVIHMFNLSEIKLLNADMSKL